MEATKKDRKVYSGKYAVILLLVAMIIIGSGFWFTPNQIEIKVIFSALIIMFFYFGLHLPYRLILNTETFSLKSCIKKATYPISSISKIIFEGKTTIIKLQNGKRIKLSYIVTGLDEFTEGLRNRNDNIEYKESAFIKSTKSTKGLLIMIIAILLIGLVAAFAFLMLANPGM